MSHPFQGELVYRRLDVGRVPKGDGVQCQPEGSELLLLFLAVGLSDLPAVAVADAARQPVAEFFAMSWVRMRRRFSLLSI